MTFVLPFSTMTHGALFAETDVESEDENEGDEVVGGSTCPMTFRQAVLASVVDSSHVSLCHYPPPFIVLQD